MTCSCSCSSSFLDLNDGEHEGEGDGDGERREGAKDRTAKGEGRRRRTKGEGRTATRMVRRRHAGTGAAAELEAGILLDTMRLTLLERRPTVAEYVELIAAVGWKPRDESAIAVALASSIFSFCAELEATTVGMGRVIGDGGLHYYVTDLVVHPAHQRRGIGSESVP